MICRRTHPQLQFCFRVASSGVFNHGNQARFAVEWEPFSASGNGDAHPGCFAQRAIYCFRIKIALHKFYGVSHAIPPTYMAARNPRPFLSLDQHSFAERSSRAPLRMTRRCLATQTRPFRTGSERDCFAHRAGSSAKRARYFPFQFAYTCTGAIRTSRRAVGIRRAIHACSHQAWRAAGGRRPSVGTGVRCHS